MPSRDREEPCTVSAIKPLVFVSTVVGVFVVASVSVNETTLLIHEQIHHT